VLTNTPGFDVDQAVSSLGSEKLYLRVIDEFRQWSAKDGEKLRAALESGDEATAHRLAHSLKSAAASVGAMELSRAAGALEEAMTSGRRADYALLAAAIEVKLGSVVDVLARSLG
jgi:HPt (histidine-containing phosphotransfer) domain-containing protein